MTNAVTAQSSRASRWRQVFFVAMAAVIPVLIWQSTDGEKDADLFMSGLAMYTMVMSSILLMIRRNDVTLLHPLFYFGCTYFVPASIGALHRGMTRPLPIYTWLLPEYDRSLILAILLTMLGYGAFCLGFILYKAGSASRLVRYLPIKAWSPQSVTAPALILIVVGDVLRLGALHVGSIGYSSTVSELGQTFYSGAVLATIGTFLLCWSMFSGNRKKVVRWISVAVIVAQSAYIILTSAGKGAPINALLTIMMSFYVTGRHLSRRGFLIFSILAGIALMGGIAYGTMFRILMGREHKATLSEYSDLATRTFRELGRQKTFQTVENALDMALIRFDTMTSLAVVMERHSELSAAEQSYGLKGNLVNDTLTALIPRFVWKDKPLVSDARSFSLLYFNRRDNSEAITLVGDLLRNGGIIGVVLGMVFLGMALKLTYLCCIVHTTSLWARYTYCMALTMINFEGFYSAILPSLIRVVIVCLMAGMFVNVVIKDRSKNARLAVANVGVSKA